MIEWMAFKANGEKLVSRDIEFSMLPLDQLIGFSVFGNKCNMYVNLVSGVLAVNGTTVENGLLERHRLEQLSGLKKGNLYYFKRAYMDFNPISGDSSGENLEYVVCGWETNKVRAYLKMSFPGEVIDLSIQELNND